MNTKEMRENAYKNMLKHGKPEFSKEQYIKQIKAHVFTLEKYLSRFKDWAKEYYENKPIKQSIEYKWVKKFYRKRPKVKDILDIFIQEDLKDEFLHYFIMKTHLCYDLKQKPSPIKIDKIRQRYYEDYLINTIDIKDRNNGNKFAEFVYIILAEYIVLHNYMWVSGLKHKDIRSIDRWLKNI